MLLDLCPCLASSFEHSSHIIQRYDDTMKEKGEEEGERKERDIYI